MGTPSDSNVDLNSPVWENTDPAIKNADVASLFATPYWMSSPPGWIACMKAIRPNIILDNRDATWNNGVDIYNQLNSGNMPQGGPKWPADAMEMFRLWYNQGGRNSKTDPFSSPPEPIPPPTPTPTRPFVVPNNPVWDAQDPSVDDIKQCFTNPCWIAGGQSIAHGWYCAMKNFQFDAFTNTPLDLQNYDHVSSWGLVIYNHLASGSMPVASDPSQKFSPEAIKAFKLWYDQGCPQTLADIGKMPLPPHPAPLPPVKKPFLVRKNINDLSASELLEYRMAILRIGSQDSSSSSIWQTGGYIHGNWCLHYMQASFPWHRAHLLWMEAQLGVAIPYWNFFSSQAADPSSPDGGIPQAFLDDTFVDDQGNTQPNPLRHAFARGGMSRASSGSTVYEEVQRAAELSDPSKRDAYIQEWMPKYLDEIYAATQITTTGVQQDAGFVFGPDDLTTWNDPSLYKNFATDFDVGLEQVHDNLHGWCGPDMANNSFAAFDPLFWSFHSNFDRLFETWLRKTADPTKIPWTPTPLRPFVISGPDATNSMTISVVEDGIFSSGQTYAVTTDLIKETSKNLGYTYLPPQKIPDYTPPRSPVAEEDPSPAPLILFPNTKCSQKTYYIHVSLSLSPSDRQLVIGEKGYVGHVTRLGMGPDNGNDRCIRNGIVRALSGAKAAEELGLKDGEDVHLKILVKQDVPDGENRVVPEEEWKNWEGFGAVLLRNGPVHKGGQGGR